MNNEALQLLFVQLKKIKSPPNVSSTTRNEALASLFRLLQGNLHLVAVVDKAIKRQSTDTACEIVGGQTFFGILTQLQTIKNGHTHLVSSETRCYRPVNTVFLRLEPTELCSNLSHFHADQVWTIEGDRVAYRLNRELQLSEIKILLISRSSVQQLSNINSLIAAGEAPNFNEGNAISMKTCRLLSRASSVSSIRQKQASQPIVNPTDLVVALISTTTTKCAIIRFNLANLLQL